MYKIKAPYQIGGSIIYIINLSLQTYLVILMFSGGIFTSFMLFIIVMYAAQVLVLLSILIKMLIKPRTLHIHQDSLQIQDRIIHPIQIKQILIHGKYFHSIGILPKDKTFVPNSLHFRFVTDNEQAMKHVIEWSALHHIQVIHKRIVSLV